MNALLISCEIPDLTKLGLQGKIPENGANTFTHEASSHHILFKWKEVNGIKQKISNLSLPEPFSSCYVAAVLHDGLWMMMT